MVAAYLGLGSNLGNRPHKIAQAIALLSQRLKIEKISSLYESQPVGYKEQPFFLNMVCCIFTELSPEELLTLAKEIERLLGRVSGFVNAPRVIDVDILFYGDQLVESPQLIIPHPRLTERAFVLVPLGEIAPHLLHPGTNRSVVELVADVEGLGGVHKWGELKLLKKVTYV